MSPIETSLQELRRVAKMLSMRPASVEELRDVLLFLIEAHENLVQTLDRDGKISLSSAALTREEIAGIPTENRRY